MLEDAGRFTHYRLVDFHIVSGVLGYDAALGWLHKARAVALPNPAFELALRVADAVGLGPDAECALRYILYTRNDGRPCTCEDEETCAVADTILRRYTYLVHQIRT